MSAKKYQLKDLVSSLSAEANKNRDPEVKRRFYLIKAVVESKKDVKKTCEMRGTSTDSFYKWSDRLLKLQNLSALKSVSRTVKYFWNKTSKRVERRVIKIRNLQPYMGPERISFKLKKTFNMICPPSTVAAILKRAGLVTKEYRDRLTKKHLKRYRRPLPGYLQMDFKYTPFLLEGRQTYQLSVVDHHSSWRFIRSYENRKAETVLKFLNEMLANVPFWVVQIQTDNAAEFTDKYTSSRGGGPSENHEVDIWCRKKSIEHKLIPIGEKEINGKVENTHKWDDREFFSQLAINTFYDLERATRDYNEIWNDQRPTKTLGWQTPNEVVRAAYVKVLSYLKVVLPEKAWAKPEKLKQIEIGTGKIIASKTEIEKIHRMLKKPKKLSPVDRYLQYLDWESRQKIKSLLPVPVILQNFSSPLSFFKRRLG